MLKRGSESLLLSLFLFIILFSGTNCLKETKLPVVTTGEVSNISDSSANCEGTIVSAGNEAITASGVCWSTNDLPTVNDSFSIDGTSSGTFVSHISGLSSKTTYHVRAYATNVNGTSYGRSTWFLTPAGVVTPTLTTSAVININHNSAQSGGQISKDGGAAVSVRGVCWSTQPSPTVFMNHTSDGSGKGSFISSLSGLLPNTTYYIRAYATNYRGTGYGNELSFKTQAAPAISIGQTYQGGIIFYVDGSGKHGLISAPFDQGTAFWGCQGSSVPTSTTLGSGNSNTFAIITFCSTPNIAARICYDLVLNGYDDWYLPSKEELKLMHGNLHLQGIGNFKLSYYYSSSQYSSIYAWSQLFNNPVNQVYQVKDVSVCKVRAIRSF